ncbi:glutathione peroxidase [Pseudogracilibacillus sp. SE30717A]|uniref:glutathione peroxidase n=1 Tax=Pseudogracilibacillus sp. SE30717A TaxID=3098293 RepID=UPI00300DFB50
MQRVYDFTVQLPDGKAKSLLEYAGKTLLIVNTASKCGFTPQFQGLQNLYDTYKVRDFVILGFPCNQFKQEYENMEDTIHFCQNNYGVSFPMFAKIDVNGENEHPLYAFLKQQKGGVFSRTIKWNFTKFLVNSEGQVVKRYSPIIKPEQIKEDIEKYIGKK